MTNQHRPVWAPDEVDIEKPSVARMYDYLLGGSHNFAADRALAEEAVRAWPDLPYIARANRAFLHRAVIYLADQGVDQFLDIGSGIPTGGSVHEIALAANKDSRTVYVDADPVACAHSEAMLAGMPNTAVLRADLRDPDSILSSGAVTNTLDLSRPVALLLVAVMPWVKDEDDPAGLVATYRDATAPGSYLALSHGTGDYRRPETGRAAEIYQNTQTPGTFRSRAHITGFFAGYELVQPGVVDVIHWRPDPEATDLSDPLDRDVARYSLLGGVGRKP